MANRDYDRIETAIRYLEAHRSQQPSLEEVAGAVGLSPFHFQRLFRRWAGISPKRFLQSLTVEHAKARLDAADSVLDAALDAGLTGPGRLHDLFVALEAVTPGEFKNAGEGLTIAYGTAPTPFGPCFLAATGRGITALQFLDHEDEEGALRRIRPAWSGARFVHRPRRIAGLGKRVFEPAGNALRRDDPGEGGAVTLLVRGTNFQLQVWRALLRIPAGSVATYEAVARAVGRPRSVRAAAGAVAANPVAYLIPCHRVLRKSGALGGYRWGTARKRAMLAYESGFENGAGERAAAS